MISNKAISYWSSGSGFAGPIAAGYYFFMTSILNISTNTTILALIWIPFVILGLFYKLRFRQNIEYLDYRNISDNIISILNTEIGDENLICGNFINNYWW